MMTTHTSMRAAPGHDTGSAGQAGSGTPGTGTARGGDFLATLAAALSLEISATTRQEGMPADLNAGEGERPDAIDALMAALAPMVPAPQEALVVPDADVAGAGATPGSAMAGQAPRLASLSPTQLADLLRETAGAAPEGSSPDNAGSQSAARELPAQLLQTLAGPVRETVPEFRLAGGIDAITGTAAQALATVAMGSSGNSTAPAGEQALRAVVGSPRWAEELGSRLVLMSTRGHQEGSLTLSPDHLGPLEVRISMNQNTAQVWFGAQHADTRAALAEALPRLREMFAEAGLSLGQAGVSQEAPRRPLPELSDAATGATVDGESSALPAEVSTRSISSALLDLYA